MILVPNCVNIKQYVTLELENHALKSSQYVNIITVTKLSCKGQIMLNC